MILWCDGVCCVLCGCVCVGWCVLDDVCVLLVCDVCVCGVWWWLGCGGEDEDLCGDVCVCVCDVCVGVCGCCGCGIVCGGWWWWICGCVVVCGGGLCVLDVGFGGGFGFVVGGVSFGDDGVLVRGVVVVWCDYCECGVGGVVGCCYG